MHRPPDVETITDFDQYYRRSYIGLRNEKGVVEPIYIDGVLDDRNVRVMYVSTHQRADMPFADLLASGVFGSPQYGMTDVGGTVVYTYKRARRQAQRGHRITGDGAVTSYHLFHRGILPPEEEDSITTLPAFLQGLFNPSYTDLHRAYAGIMDADRLCTSLSRLFAMGIVEGVTKPVLFYKTKMIGYFLAPDMLEASSGDSKELITYTFPTLKLA
jgi:hypothetical protein